MHGFHCVGEVPLKEGSIVIMSASSTVNKSSRWTPRAHAFFLLKLRSVNRLGASNRALSPARHQSGRWAAQRPRAFAYSFQLPHPKVWQAPEDDVVVVEAPCRLPASSVPRLTHTEPCLQTPNDMVAEVTHAPTHKVPRRCTRHPPSNSEPLCHAETRGSSTLTTPTPR